MPKENRDYWTAKIGRNRERDAQNIASLTSLGWSVLTLWECELTDDAAIRDRLAAFLSPH
jgi:DNA mismatch endonuclease, patch repair protein